MKEKRQKIMGKTNSKLENENTLHYQMFNRKNVEVVPATRAEFMQQNNTAIHDDNLLDNDL